MKLKELTNDEFKEFTEKYSLSSMYQSVEYGLVMNNQNYKSIFVGLNNDNSELVAASLIIIEKLGQFKYAYAPRGFLIDYTDIDLLTNFTMEIKKYLKKKNIIAIKICPIIAKTKYTPNLNITLINPSYENIFNNLKNLKYYHLGYNNYFESFKPRFEAIVELKKDTKEMFQELEDNVKEKILNCELAGISVIKGNNQIIEHFYKQLSEEKAADKEYIQNMHNYFSTSNNSDIYFAQLNTNTYLVNTQIEYQKQINICNELTDNIFKNQGKDNNNLIKEKIEEDNKLSLLKKQIVYATNLLRNNPNGIIMAIAMIIKHNNQLYLINNEMDEKYKKFCSEYLLIWKLIEKYASDGYKELNLGGIANPTVINNKVKKINELKLNFNSNVIEYAGDFELVTHFPLYTLYRNSVPFRKVLKK